MTTARHNGQGEFVVRRHKCGDTGRDSGVFDLIDRPLRRAAGDDLVLLRIFRGTLVGTIAAAIVAVACAAIW
jgi:hypothetical protein